MGADVGVGARVSLGRSGVQVSRFGLGTAPLGGLLRPVETQAAQDTVAAALDAGFGMFDTAPLYGFGEAERRLGRILAGRPLDDLVIATKVGRLIERGAPPDPSQIHQGRSFWPAGDPEVNPVRDYSAAGVIRSLEESRARLGIDRIDIAHVHDPEDHEDQARDEAIPALCELRARGQLRAVGIGVNETALPTRLIATGVDCLLIAGRYTLLDQSALDELLPAAIDHEVGIIAGGVYNSGVLADPFGAEPTYDYLPASAAIVDRARRIHDICHAHGVPPLAAALQFPLGHPAVRSVLIGARSVAELEENRRLATLSIPTDVWEHLQAEGLLRGDAPLPIAEGD
ncbi:MAG: aldo/keto reductase [Nitriliruptoraceae bacterium]|nr:aldo/keto reductase [Nitriliruptoraceae bacterium]